MKKLTIALLVLALAAMSVVNCFAADVSTAITDLDLVYFEDFSDISDIAVDDNYIIEANNDGTAFLCFAGSKYPAYALSNAPTLSGENKLTFVFSYSLETAIGSKLIGFTFGVEDVDNYYYLGINNDPTNGIKTYHCPFVDGTYKTGDSNDQRVYDYQFTDAEFTTKDLGWADVEKVYTVVIEVEIGKEPVYSFWK